MVETCPPGSMLSMAVYLFVPSFGLCNCSGSGSGPSSPVPGYRLGSRESVRLGRFH